MGKKKGYITLRKRKSIAREAHDLFQVNMCIFLGRRRLGSCGYSSVSLSLSLVHNVLGMGEKGVSHQI
jgi:hypothetical protein